MDKEEAKLELIEWVERHSKILNQEEISKMLILNGTSMAYFCSSSKKQAEFLIQHSVEEGYKDVLQMMENL